MRNPPPGLALSLLVLMLVCCQPGQSTEEVPQEPPSTIATIDIDTARSLITWITKGETLNDGAIKIDSGAFEFANESLHRVGIVSEEVVFGVSDTIDHYLWIEVESIATLDSASLANAEIEEDFRLTSPTHVANISIQMADEEMQRLIPIRVGTFDTGIELEGKLRVDSQMTFRGAYWEDFYLGFLLHTDKTE